MPINEAVSPPPIAEPTKILIKLTIPTSGSNCKVKGNKTTIPKITPNPGNTPIITPDKTEWYSPQNEIFVSPSGKWCDGPV